MSFLGDLFGAYNPKPAQKALAKGTGLALSDLAQGYSTATGAINQAYRQAIPSAQAGITPYQQLYQYAQPGIQEYSSFLGAGTPSQQAQAQQVFAGSPYGQDLSYN